MSGVNVMALKLGFIGGGLNSAVGYTHYLASRMDGIFDVRAGVFSRSASVNKATGDKFGVEPDRLYHNVDEFLSAEAGRLDAVCVLSPTPDHAHHVVGALSSGFNVICEKAIATCHAECEQISSALADSKKFLGVTFNYAGYPMVREARQMILGGDLGAIQQIYCEMPQESFSRRGATPQGWRKRDYRIPCVSLDLGVHVLHLVEYLSGAEMLECAAVQESSFGKIRGVIDTVNVLATYTSGALANMIWTKAALGHRNGLRVRVFGEAGSLEWYQADPEQLLYCKEDGSRQFIDRGQPGLIEAGRQRYNRFKAGHPAGFIEAFSNVYHNFGEVISGDTSNDEHYFLSAAVAMKGIIDLEKKIHSEADKP